MSFTLRSHPDVACALRDDDPLRTAAIERSHCVEEFVVGQWEERFAQKDANDLLAMLWSWQNADISANAMYNDDFEAALRGIKAKALVMPSQTDQYFPVADSDYEVSILTNAELRPIPSIWGHMAGSPGLNPKDNSFLDGAMMGLLES